MGGWTRKSGSFGTVGTTSGADASCNPSNSGRHASGSSGLGRNTGHAGDTGQARSVRDRNREWTEYFSQRLAEAEKELADFRSAIASYKLRVCHRDIYGERDVTEQELIHLEEAVEEYRRMLRED